jgi:hypothetical protein
MKAIIKRQRAPSAVFNGPENRMGLTFCILFIFYQAFFVIRGILAGMLFKDAAKVALVGEARQVSNFG